MDVIRVNRSIDSHLAGASALHLDDATGRISNDLDFFHDSPQRVRSAYEADRSSLIAAGYDVDEQIAASTFIRAVVGKSGASTLIDWAFDSAWRFLPVLSDPLGGYVLHPVDLAINKTLALVGRDEARDYVDLLYAHRRILPLGALIWAAPAKDPGFNPMSLLELLRRRGRPRPEAIAELRLTSPFDFERAKTTWMHALDEAAQFIVSRPGDEVGHLYLDTEAKQFVMPAPGALPPAVRLHGGGPGGVLPVAADASLLPDVGERT
jgi:hypothetical protein